MAIAYEGAVTTAAAGAGAAYAEIYNASRRAKVRELGMFSQAATVASKTQLIRTTNTTTASTTVTVQAQDAADAVGTTVIATAWSVAPTVGANVPLRQWDFNNVAGSGVIFTWPSDGELLVPLTHAAGTLAVWNGGAATGPACDLYIVVSE